MLMQIYKFHLSTWIIRIFNLLAFFSFFYCPVKVFENGIDSINRKRQKKTSTNNLFIALPMLHVLQMLWWCSWFIWTGNVKWIRIWQMEIIMFQTLFLVSCYAKPLISKSLSSRVHDFKQGHIGGRRKNNIHSQYVFPSTNLNKISL